MVFNKWGEGKKVNSQEEVGFYIQRPVESTYLNVLFQKEVLKEYK